MDRAEQLAQTASWNWNLEDNSLLWSDNMFRLFGLEPGEITPTPRYVIGRIHPEESDHRGVRRLPCGSSSLKAEGQRQRRDRNPEGYNDCMPGRRRGPWLR